MKSNRIFILIFIVIVLVVVGIVFYKRVFVSDLASIEIDSNKTVDVYIDGKNVGKTPYTQTIAAKQITLDIGSYETQVTLQPMIKTIVQRDFNDDLSESFGSVISFEKTGINNSQLVVITDPGGASISFDGNVIGNTPYELDNLKEGSHGLEVNLQGYEDKKFNINLYNGYKLTLQVDLSPEVTTQLQNVTQQELTQAEVEILSTPNGFLRVRSQPDTASSEIARVHQGDKFPLVTIDKKSGWFEIQLTASKSGWISNVYASTSSGETKD